MRKRNRKSGRVPMLKKRLGDFSAVLFGSALFGAAVNIFTLPTGIIPGGATGLSVILNRLMSTPVGLTVIAVNIPLFLAAFKKLGRSFLVQTALATVVSSLAIDLLSFLPAYTEDRLLSCIFGALMSGAGLGVIYTRGITTGGSDLLSRLISERLNRISFGRILLAIDGVIVLAGAVFVYRDITAAFYSMIYIYISTNVVDIILSGTDKAAFCIIVTNRHDEIEKGIISVLDRSATLIDGIGAYRGERRHIIICAVKRFELRRLEDTVYKVDPAAFLICTKAARVVGCGFIEPRGG